MTLIDCHTERPADKATGAINCAISWICPFSVSSLWDRTFQGWRKQEMRLLRIIRLKFGRWMAKKTLLWPRISEWKQNEKRFSNYHGWLGLAAALSSFLNLSGQCLLQGSYLVIDWGISESDELLACGPLKRKLNNKKNLRSLPSLY